MSLEKFQSCLRAVNEHRSQQVGATCPRPDTLTMRYNALSSIQKMQPNATLYHVAHEYAQRVHKELAQKTLTPDPIKASPQMNLSAQESKFMQLLMSQPSGTVRTDALAAVLGVGCTPTAQVGLNLRARNLVTSTNDNKTYNVWSVTEYAKAMFAEAERLANLPPKVSAKKANEWILWSPTSKLPPSVRYSCEQEAMAVAESMAKRYPGQQFLCCEIHAGFKLVETKQQKVVYETVSKLEQV